MLDVVMRSKELKISTFVPLVRVFCQFPHVPFLTLVCTSVGELGVFVVLFMTVMLGFALTGMMLFGSGSRMWYVTPPRYSTVQYSTVQCHAEQCCVVQWL